jgi:hypothetical protein
MRTRRVRFRVFGKRQRQRATGETTVPFNLGRRVGFNCDLRFFHTEVACEIAPESG